MEVIVNTLYTVFLFLDGIIYSFIGPLFRVFVAITKVNLFSETIFEQFISRVFTILGIIMLFFMAYQILFMIVDPAKLKSDNAMKRTIRKLLISLVLLLLLPTAFEYIQIFQNNVINSNIIGNVILDSAAVPESESCISGDISCAGTNIALTISQTFYHPVLADGTTATLSSCTNEHKEDELCELYVSEYTNAANNDNGAGLFTSSALKDELNLSWWERVTGDSRNMKYIPVFSTFAGAFALWMILLFTIDMGVRVAKLGFLQIISPVPILKNITESTSLTQTKWFKQLTSTYLEVFIKLIIINFAIFCIRLVPELITTIFSNFASISGNGWFVALLANVVLILGILKFALDAPKLIKEVFDISGDGLKLGLGGLSERVARPASMVAGAALSGLSNAHAFNKDLEAMKEEREGQQADGTWGMKGRLSQARRISSGVGGIGAGFTSGFGKATELSKEAKTFSDMKDSIVGAREATDIARLQRDTRIRDRQDQRDEDLKVGQQNLSNAAEKFTDKEGTEYTVGKTVTSALAGNSVASRLAGRASKVKDSVEKVITGGPSKAQYNAANEASNTSKTYQDHVSSKPAVDSIKATHSELKTAYRAERKLSLNTISNNRESFTEMILKRQYDEEYRNLYKETMNNEGTKLLNEKTLDFAKKNNITVEDVRKDSEIMETLFQNVKQEVSKEVGKVMPNIEKEISDSLSQMSDFDFAKKAQSLSEELSINAENNKKVEKILDKDQKAELKEQWISDLKKKGTESYFNSFKKDLSETLSQLNSSQINQIMGAVNKDVDPDNRITNVSEIIDRLQNESTVNTAYDQLKAFDSEVKKVRDAEFHSLNSQKK